MTIVGKIKASIQSVLGEDYPVYYNDDPGANMETSRMEFPCALVKLLTTGNARNEAGQVKEIVSAAVFFLNLTTFDFDAEENEDIVDACKTDAFTWLRNIGGDFDLQLMSEARTSRVYQQYDDIVTGFGVLADLKELKGTCI